jgi:hypothetical protein
MTATNPTPPPAPRDAASYLYPGSIADQIGAQLGVLTQGVVDCMILATGAYPDLTEGAPQEPNAWTKASPKGSAWQAARSAELHDAARLSEASARLLTGFAKLRAQFSQDFTIRHTDDGDAKSRKRKTTVTHRFSTPQKLAVSEDNVPPEVTADLTRNLARMAQGVADKAKAKRQANTGETRAEITRRLMEKYAQPQTPPAPPTASPGK